MVRCHGKSLERHNGLEYQISVQTEETGSSSDLAKKSILGSHAQLDQRFQLKEQDRCLCFLEQI